MSSGESASSSDEEEDARDYKKGGYHPVKIGELFKDAAYEVLTKIGWGHFSTVWLAWDRRADRPVALKIQKSAQRYSEAAVDEIELLKQVAASERAEERNLVLLRDSFVHRGVNGKHHVLAFEVVECTELTNDAIHSVFLVGFGEPIRKLGNRFRDGLSSSVYLVVNVGNVSDIPYVFVEES